MMKYVGSKNRYAKDLLPIILKDRKPNQVYVEPFVGGFNLIDKVSNPRIGNDINFYLIELFRAIQNGWDPPTEISETDYKTIEDNKEQYHPHLVGFVGFGCSFGAKFFGGYARSSDKENPRNYCGETRRNLLKQAKPIQGITILNLNYWEIPIPDNSIIYCDPPYCDTLQYKDKIDDDAFWTWVRDKVKENHSVFVSEYNAPDDFKAIWKKETKTLIDKNKKNQIRCEKLFRHESQITLETSLESFIN